MVTTPIRSSIQYAKDWPTPTTASPIHDTHALVLAIISSLAPLLDHPRFAVGKLVLHVDAAVLAYLECVVVKALRGRTGYEASVNVVDPAVTGAQDLAPIPKVPHRAAQEGTVVAHDV